MKAALLFFCISAFLAGTNTYAALSTPIALFALALVVAYQSDRLIQKLDSMAEDDE